MNFSTISRCFWSLGVVLLCFSGCSSMPPLTSIDTHQELLLKDVCLKNNVKWHWDSSAYVVTLSFYDIEARALIDSDVVVINDQRIQLSHPIRMSNSAILVPIDFERKVVRFLKKNAQVEKTTNFVTSKVRAIMIDAGHGGKDPGALGSHGLDEKEVVLDIALRLRRILANKDIKVIMTREDDRFLTLQERTELASRLGVDLFISIHANTSPAKSASGVEVFALRELESVEKQQEQRQLNGEIMFKDLQMKKNHQELNEMLNDMLYTYKQGASESLGEQASKTTAQFARTKNRGLKRSGFFVLKNTLIPAVLIEVGFLSHPKEGALLNSKVHRQKIAFGIARSVLNYLDD